MRLLICSAEQRFFTHLTYVFFVLPPRIAGLRQKFILYKYLGYRTARVRCGQ